MRVALIGYGNVGKAFARLLAAKRSSYPFRIVGAHTAHHGTAYAPKGLDLEPSFGAPAGSVEEFLANSQPDIAIEITTLNPEDGQPATSHIQTALRLGIHAVTANKGPIAHSYGDLCEQARAKALQFRFEATVMDGMPVFNLVRNNLPGVRILGFEGVLNSTSKIVAAAMARGGTLEEGIREAQSMGIAEADVSNDLDGWDSAAKTAALANVLMHAGTTPQMVKRETLHIYSAEQLVALAREEKTVMIVSEAVQGEHGLELCARPRVVGRGELLASANGTSNLLLLHTDLMGTLGVISINPGVQQTAYGLFSDVVDIAQSV